MIGTGGMGVVYRAHDLRLKRDVALKVLPPELARDAGRVLRFEQESLAAAALSHPNVLSVFDVGIDESGPYVVSELLEGETLGAALLRGALPHRVALDVATQTARGMAAAHQRGIVHRDLKPENIFLITDGRVKLLDFGLAKLTESTAHWPAETAVASIPGTMLGTPGYMSPEQVRGEATDFRTDIFAFGAVLHELRTASRAFGGDSAVVTITGHAEPNLPNCSRAVRPPSTARPPVPRQDPGAAVRRPATSRRAARIVPLAPVPAVPAAAPWRRRWLPFAAAAALVAAGIAIGALAARRPAPAAETASFRALTFERWPVTGARFMPDGQTIVYSAAPRGLAPELFVLSPNVEGPQPLGIPNTHLLSVLLRGRAGHHHQRAAYRAAALRGDARADDDGKLPAGGPGRAFARPTGRPTASRLRPCATWATGVIASRTRPARRSTRRAAT